MKTSMIVLAAAVVFGAAAFASVDGCTSSTADAGDDTGPDSTPTVDDCTECLAQTCRPETERCVDDSDCLAILFCVEVANDAGGCTTQAATANGRCLFEQLADCVVTRECDSNNSAGCNTACEDTVNPHCGDAGVTSSLMDAMIAEDGGASTTTGPGVAADCPGGDTSGSTACDSCAASACAAQAAACAVTKFSTVSPTYDSQCNEYEACRTECRDSDCESRCAAGFPMGKTASDTYDACLAASCANVCGAAITGDAGSSGDAGDAGDAGDP